MASNFQQQDIDSPWAHNGRTGQQAKWFCTFQQRNGSENFRPPVPSTSKLMIIILPNGYVGVYPIFGHSQTATRPPVFS